MYNNEWAVIGYVDDTAQSWWTIISKKKIGKGNWEIEIYWTHWSCNRGSMSIW